jgi:aminoglycoside phosphotransferase (APT) family kinase protein
MTGRIANGSGSGPPSSAELSVAPLAIGATPGGPLPSGATPGGPLPSGTTPGGPLPSGPRLIQPLPAHRLDAERLSAYLHDRVPGFADKLTVRQFQGGQSNPTYLLETPETKAVLRKKPPGKLLPSAHQIDREFRIQQALRDTDVPVANMLHFCTDPEVIGTEFYVMEHLQGRVFGDVMMGELTPRERGSVQAALFEVIGNLHAVDFAALGLADFGRANQYVARQLTRWRGQYEAAKTEELPDMDRLMDWLAANMPEADETAIAHGDFRLGNMMVHPEEPVITAVLDWELATLGHPLADLAYCCMPFHMPQGSGTALTGYGGVDLKAHGLADEDEVLELYCRATGRGEIPNWKFFLGFALFRSAAIVEGVYARALAGNAADARGIAMHEMTKLTSTRGWEIVQG